MDKFMVDTSVWIDFFRGKLKAHILENLTEGIRNREIVISDIIRHEILVGSKNDEDYRQLADLLRPLHFVRIKNDELEDFDLFAWKASKKGVLGKYTDISIAYLCHQNQWPLLSFDGYFKHLKKLGLIRLIEYSDF